MRAVKRLPLAVSAGMLCIWKRCAGLTIRNQAVLRNAYIEPQLQSGSRPEERHADTSSIR